MSDQEKPAGALKTVEADRRIKLHDDVYSRYMLHAHTMLPSPLWSGRANRQGGREPYGMMIRATSEPKVVGAKESSDSAFDTFLSRVPGLHCLSGNPSTLPIYINPSARRSHNHDRQSPSALRA